MWAWKYREPVLDLLEAITGNRNNYGNVRVGGCREDIPNELIPKILKELDKLGKKVLMLHGNHELERELRQDCKKTKNVKFMHRALLRKNGIVFLGYGGGGFATYIDDYKAKKIRYVTKEDSIKQFILGDALTNYEFMHANCYPHDVPRITSDRYMWALGFTHQTKHLISDTYGRDSIRDLIEMGIAITGSFEELQKRPIFCIDGTTLSPLTIDKNQVQHMMEAAKNKLPIAVHAGAIGGGTAPVTLAGIITQCNAEVLGSITLTVTSTPITSAGRGNCLYTYVIHSLMFASETAGTPSGKRATKTSLFVPADMSVTMPFTRTLSPIATTSS